MFNIIVPICIILLDQFSKLWVVKNLIWHQTFHLINTKFFGINLFLTYNTGAAFGLLHDKSGWQNYLFLIIALIVALFILYLLIKNKINNNIERLGLLLILGGSVGNMLDRVMYNYVIDFIDVYYKNFHWYTFNIADSAICLAVMLLLLPKNLRIN
jgi:signal peptidase II